VRVALDTQLAIGTATGIGSYAGCLLAALRDAGVDAVGLADARLDPWRFDRRVAWDQVLLPRRARRSGAELLHCTSGTMPLWPPLPCIVTVHDVAWLKVQQHARPYARWYFGRFMLARYRRARRIVVDSLFSRQELLSVLAVDASRIDVIYPGVDAEFCTLDRAPDGTQTILAPGTVERRKNIEVLIRALPALPGARIVSVGPATSYRETCMALARRLAVESRVEFRGYVTRAELLRLYAACALVAVPSRYEGFGYAAAQALCAGTPLVVSNAGALRELAGDAGTVRADDVTAWRDRIAHVLHDGASADARAANARSRARERFAWRTCAQHMRQAYERALAIQ